MADDTKLKYIVELLTKGDTKKATEELNKLHAASDKTTKGLSALSLGWGKLFALVGGTAVINQSINAFLEQERAVAKLNAALKATGEFTPELSKEMQDLAESLSQVSLFADEAILNVIAKLTAMGVRGSQDVRRLTTTILDLSTLMDRDLNRATLAMTAALRGNFDMLKMVGVQVEETGTLTERLSDAMGQLATKTGGQATEAAETFGGQVEQARKRMGEFKEAIGGLIATGLNPLIEKLAASDGLLKQITERAAFLNFAGKKGSTTGGTLAGIIELLVGNPLAEANLMKAIVGQTGIGKGIGNIVGQVMPSAPAVKPPPDIEGARGALATFGSAFFEVSDKDALRVADARQKAIQDEMALRAKASEFQNKLDEEHQAKVLEMVSTQKQLHEELTLAQLDGADRVRMELEFDHEERLEKIRQLQTESGQSIDEAIDLENQRHSAVMKNYDEEQAKLRQAGTLSARLNVNMQDLAVQGIQMFAGGLSGAIVGAFEEGDKAFQKFAQNFLRGIAEMILQALILKMIKGALGVGFSTGGQAGSVGSTGGFKSSTDFTANFAAMGGLYSNTIRAASGVPGVSDLSSPTFFPKFNVLAGEAGREVMTVLSRPRFERINGVPAQVGMAGGQRLAIANADALASGGGGVGGNVVIEVRVSQGSEARIIESSIKGARLQVIQDLHDDTPVSRGVKALST